MAKGNPAPARPRCPRLLTSARAWWVTLRAHRARGPLPPAHGEAEKGREIPQQRPPYCEAGHVLRPAGGQQQPGGATAKAWQQWGTMLHLITAGPGRGRHMAQGGGCGGAGRARGSPGRAEAG